VSGRHEETLGHEAFGRPTWTGLGSWGIDGALMRYRIMAYVVGVGLILLVFVGLPLQFAAHQTLVVQVVGTIHGYLYLVYLAAALDLARRAHWRLGRIVAVVAAGFVPFLAFVIEHRVLRQMREEHAAELADGSSEPGRSVAPGVAASERSTSDPAG
jgi:integral membrane protein